MLMEANDENEPHGHRVSLQNGRASFVPLRHVLKNGKTGDYRFSAARRAKINALIDKKLGCMCCTGWGLGDYEWMKKF